MISKEAKRIYDKQYREKNREMLIAKKAIYTKNNKEIKKQYDKQYREKNVNLIKAKRQQHYEKNQEKFRQRSKQYYNINKKKISKRTRVYREQNKEKIQKRQRLYTQRTWKERLNYLKKYKLSRQKRDINYKLSCYLRTRIYIALKRNTKSDSTKNLLGCSVEFLKKHLEYQFKEGMGWDNYGKWHVDHIRPCASFDLSKPEEQRKCFHYTNLQPLWAKDNLFKSDKIYDGNTR